MWWSWLFLFLFSEFLEVGKKQPALDVLYDVIKSKKHRTWQKIHEPIMLKYLELCVDLRKSHLAKEGLYQYKNICQQVWDHFIFLLFIYSLNVLTFVVFNQNVINWQTALLWHLQDFSNHLVHLKLAFFCLQFRMQCLHLKIQSTTDA